MTPTNDESIYVLHVDDDPDFGELAAEFLEREDDRLEVYTVTSPEEGMAVLHEWEIDCVVSDYEMGGRDGLEFRSAVHAEYPELPFILYTGRGSEEIASAAISEGVTDYLQKGGGADQYTVLANRIANAVESRRSDIDRERHLDAMETAQVGISILDENGDYIHVTERYADLYGYEPDELLGEHWEIVYRDEASDEIAEEIRRLVDGEGSWQGELLGVRADGGTFYEEHALTTTVGGALVCCVRDITDRKECERRFETLVDNVPGVVYRCRNEPERPMEEIRGDVATLTGHSATALRSGDVSLGEEIIHPDDRAAVWDAVRTATTAGESFELTYRIVTDAGDTRWVREHGQATPSMDGEVTTLEGFITDVTDCAGYRRDGSLDEHR